MPASFRGAVKASPAADPSLVTFAEAFEESLHPG